jgi:hypothetical protein
MYTFSHATNIQVSKLDELPEPAHLFYMHAPLYLLLGSTTRGLETNGGLEAVVDPPLETGECAYHDDTHAETLPEAHEADLLDDSADASLGGLVELGHEGVCGVRDDGAENTGDVTGGEGDSELSGLAVGVLGVGEHVGVEGLDGALEGGELHHGVGNLTTPERTDTLVEAAEKINK